MIKKKYCVFTNLLFRDSSLLRRLPLLNHLSIFRGLLYAVGSFAICSLYSICFTNNSVSAYTASITTSGTVNIDVSPAGNGANVAKDTVTIDSSCPLGYTLSINGSTSDNKLYKDGTSTNATTNNTINPSTGTISSPKPITGTTSGTSNLNTWGYNLEALPFSPTGTATTPTTPTSSSNFIGLTGTNTTILTKPTQSGNGLTGTNATTTDDLDIYYGVSVDTNIESGTYKMANNATIVYTLIANANCNNYAIRYNDNGANSTTKMGNQSVNTSSDLTLWASNFKRPDSANTNANSYGFAGWSLEQLDPNASDFKTKLATAVSQGKVYGPNQTILQADLQSFLDNNVTIDNGAQYVDLYAIWVKSEGNIQSWTGCSAMNIGDITALKDQRDNNVYTVAKLADGKCWMTENLRLDNTNSDNSTGVLAQGYANNFIGLADPETADFNNSTTANTLYSTDGSTAAPAITGSITGYRFPRYNNNNTNAAATQYNPNTTVSSMTAAGQNVYSYGNYYTWSAAIADTSYYNTGNHSITTTSICPKGWQLPIGGNNANASNSDFWKLGLGVMGASPSTIDSIYNVDYYGSETNTEGNTASETFRNYPNNFVYSGIYNNKNSSPPTFRGAVGYYSSSTIRASGSGYFLYLTDSTLYPGTLPVNSFPGFSIRCVASTPYTITFNSNTGSGTMSDQTAFIDNKTTLNSNAFTAPTGMQFAGWNTAANGSGTNYADGAEIINLTTANQTITLYAQWTKTAVAGYVVYDGNGNTSTFGMGDQQATATTIELWAANYAKDGYGFAGWSETQLDPDDTNFYTNLNTAVSQNKVYGPNQTVNRTDVSGKVLYAIWVPVAKNSSNTELTFQTTNLLTTALSSFNGGGTLNSKPNGYVTALRDQRDNQVYAVAKLADGNYWMIENLRLDNTAELSTDNTNNPSLPIVNSRDQTTGDILTSSNHLSASQDLTQTAWCVVNSAACIDQSMLFTGNTTNPVSTMSPENGTGNNASNANIYSYGNYYNWYSAIAGTGSYSVTSGNATGSICPKGWHLPTGYAGGEFSALDSAMGGSGTTSTTSTTPTGAEMSGKWRSYPNNFVYSGFVGGPSVYNRSSQGIFSSSTIEGNNGSIALQVNKDSLYPGTVFEGKRFGRPVRCVAGS